MKKDILVDAYIKNRVSGEVRKVELLKMVSDFDASEWTGSCGCNEESLFNGSSKGGGSVSLRGAECTTDYSLLVIDPESKEVLLESEWFGLKELEASAYMQKKALELILSAVQEHGVGRNRAGAL